MRNEIMERVNNVLYESKLIGYPAELFRNKVRTFCQNPGGFVSQENYDGGLAVVNGHSYKERKSENTNLAILCTHNFLEPFTSPSRTRRKSASCATRWAPAIFWCSVSATFWTASARGKRESSRPTFAPRFPTPSRAT